jgi:ABC-type transport system involved in multi-copper enzyme maturation permease subunit
MRNLWTIFRRELAAYYSSAIGYIFMIVFQVLSVGLFMTPFFTFLNADMRSFFSTMPIIMGIFLPAITMRLWAEERKQNTWEMLLTFPMRPHELVLGKFAASLVFFLGALATTLTIPLMLMWLGNPDLGPIVGAYVGTVLLGAFFLALGLFISSLCQDQIVAFVVTLLICLAVFLLGTGFISAYIDGAWPGLGTFLAQVVGMTDHYDTFARGLVVIGDVLYFLIWTAVFLFLNCLFLEIRSRPVARNTFFGAVALSLAIGLMANWLLAGQGLGRFDLTQDQIYTLSEASTKILRGLDVPAQVKLYITPSDKMPTEMKHLERDLLDKLNEMSLASRGKLKARAIHMETANVIEPVGAPPEQGGNDKEEAIERRLLDKGVRPFSVQALREDEVVNKLVYSAIGVAYKDKEEEILPQVLPQDLETLEYRLVNTIYKLSRPQQPAVAMIAPQESVNIPPYMRQLYQQMGRPLPQADDPYESLQQLLQIEKYDVRRVDLTATSGLPEDVNTIVVINPRELSERQHWELQRALHEGKSVMLAVQNYRWNYNVVRKNIQISKQDERPEVNPWLEKYGITVDSGILMDVNHQPLTVRQSDNPLASLLGGGVTLNLPLHMTLAQESMNRKASITSNLSPLFYLWGSALQVKDDVLQQHQLERQVLLTSSPHAWTAPGESSLTQASLQPPLSGGQQYPLAVLVKGQFPDTFAGKERPAWPPQPQHPGGPVPPPPAEDTPAAEPKPAPGQLLVVGGAQMFHRSFLSGGNLDFFLNSVDALTLGEDIVNVRGKKQINRAISKPAPAVRQFWKFVNLGLMPLVIAVLGIGSAIGRRRARTAYTVLQTA